MKVIRGPDRTVLEGSHELLVGMFERNVLDRDAFQILLTEGISKFVDHHLGPLVKKTPSYVKDTNDFLSKLHEICVPPEN